MYKIKQIDGENHERIVGENPEYPEAIKLAAKLSIEFSKKTPNNPTVEVSGPGEVSVFIGVQRIVTFQVTPNEGK